MAAESKLEAAPNWASQAVRVRRGEAARLAVILLVALAAGLVFVWLMPPWQHYDEPNHFEYAWLVANRSGWPQPGDHDPQLSYQVVSSMAAHGFYDGMAYQPDLRDPDQVRIGLYSQLEEKPLYYFLAALPLRLLAGSPIEIQLRAARLVSLALFLAAVAAMWGMARELTHTRSPLRWLAPLSLAVLPGFLDIMTAVNNDVAAIAIFSLFLWGSIRLVKHGFSWLGAAWVLAAAALAGITKSTVYLALPLAPLVLLLSLLRGRSRLWLGSGIALVGIAGLFTFLTWDNAAGWYPRGLPPTSTRVQLRAASPSGGYALQVPGAPGLSDYRLPQLIQLLPWRQAEALSGQALTLGAWMWASRPVEVSTPALVAWNGSAVRFSEPVSIGVEPAFYAFIFHLPEDPGRAWVALGAPLPAGSEPVQVFFDDILLVEGERPLQERPQFSAPDASQGTWGNQPFTNLVSNPSAQAVWPRWRPQIEALGKQAFSDPNNDSLTVALYSLLDVRATDWYYYSAVLSIFRTFWGKFGWSHVPLLGHRPYFALGWFTLLGIVGVLLAGWRQRRSLPWGVWSILVISGLGVLGLALLRGSNYVIQPYRVYLPLARYVFPAAAPAWLALNAGWLEIFRRLGSRLRLDAAAGAVVLGLFFLGLYAYAFLSIAAYYGM